MIKLRVFMKTTGSAGSIEISENSNTQTPLWNCLRSKAEISFLGHWSSVEPSPLPQNSTTENSQISGYQTSFQWKKTYHFFWKPLPNV